MRIDTIILNNFGSYEGETVFDTGAEQGKNIVLIGGKNGAGKTTLFTAMRVCLYGFMSMGYKNYNAFYIRTISKLINNAAKMVRPATAFVKMSVSINNSRGVDHFELLRKWHLDETLTETFSVKKNNVILSDEETADFEKFILAIIPPELFNLYFFDGEKIADFFMEEGGNTRIKNAFLTLCGYDTFDIMRKNFKRMVSGKGQTTPAFDEYMTLKEHLSEAQEARDQVNEQLNDCIVRIDACESSLLALEKDYRQKGGITQEEWNEKIALLKAEEKKRESWNLLLRKWANDVVPFIMIRDQISALREQITNENNSRKLQDFFDVIETPEISKILDCKKNTIKDAAFRVLGEPATPILDLSIEQSAILISQINQVLTFDPENIAKCKKAIKRSLKTTAKTRAELDSSSITSVNEYMKNRTQLLEQKTELLAQRVELEKKLIDQDTHVQQTETALERVQNQLESELKKASIADISSKAIIMLDKLQQRLYRRQIEKVEDFFRAEIKTLMRKTHIIDDIYIDDNFSIHLYREEEVSAEKLKEILSTNSQEQVESLLGELAIRKLLQQRNADSWNEIVAYFNNSKNESIVLPIEIDKSSLSNGEKQIFIMALYHSLVQLCNHEIPFIIDTPFARIDTEHRQNIAEHFFCGLKGQVFILSTNEEISSSHIQIMKDKIAATYMLENADNKKTVVISNKYFEV